MFGHAFAEALFAAPGGAWSGPVTSSLEPIWCAPASERRAQSPARLDPRPRAHGPRGRAPAVRRASAARAPAQPLPDRYRISQSTYRQRAPGRPVIRRALSPMAMLAAVVALAGRASAHEFRPAILDITDLGAGRYEMVWIAPSSGGDPEATVTEPRSFPRRLPARARRRRALHPRLRPQRPLPAAPSPSVASPMVTRSCVSKGPEVR